MRGGENFRILGRLETIREKRLKDSSRRLIVLSFSDPEGFFEATMFDKQAKKYPFLQEGAAIVLQLDCVRMEARDSVQMRVVKMTTLEKFIAGVSKRTGKNSTLKDKSIKDKISTDNLASSGEQQLVVPARAVANGAKNRADALDDTPALAQNNNKASQQATEQYKEQTNVQVQQVQQAQQVQQVRQAQQVQAVERLQLFVGEKSRDWNPRELAKLLEDQASVGSGKIELHIRQENRLLRVSLSQNYRLDDSLEKALKSLDGIDRVERMQAA